MEAVPPRDSVDGGARSAPLLPGGGRPADSCRRRAMYHQVRDDGTPAATPPARSREQPPLLPLDLSLLVSQLSPPETPGTSLSPPAAGRVPDLRLLLLLLLFSLCSLLSLRTDYSARYRKYSHVAMPPISDAVRIDIALLLGHCNC